MRKRMIASLLVILMIAGCFSLRLSATTVADAINDAQNITSLPFNEKITLGGADGLLIQDSDNDYNCYAKAYSIDMEKDQIINVILTSDDTMTDYVDYMIIVAEYDDSNLRIIGRRDRGYSERNGEQLLLKAEKTGTYYLICAEYHTEKVRQISADLSVSLIEDQTYTATQIMKASESVTLPFSSTVDLDSGKLKFDDSFLGIYSDYKRICAYNLELEKGDQLKL